MVALGSDSPKQYDDTTETDGLQGTWRLVSLYLAGSEVRPTNSFITFRGDRWSSSSDGQITSEGRYWTHKHRMPSSLHVRYTAGPGKGETSGYIYRIDGDWLIEACVQHGEALPKGFHHDPDNGLHYIYSTYKRVK
jgi:uncharacterized protein (TIGR03067 family)